MRERTLRRQKQRPRVTGFARLHFPQIRHWHVNVAIAFAVIGILTVCVGIFAAIGYGVSALIEAVTR